ncbi:MAG: hypothetical protein H6Q74_2825 [Firmicutes bacterium]|nr:hypothetical protein [Bacillota bacterium]
MMRCFWLFSKAVVLVELVLVLVYGACSAAEVVGWGCRQPVDRQRQASGIAGQEKLDKLDEHLPLQQDSKSLNLRAKLLVFFS